MQVGEVIIRYPQYLKAHLVATNGEGLDFGGFVCLCNILTHIQQRLKGEETLLEVVKHKKYLVSFNISEDESITVYPLYIVAPGLLGGKHSTKSHIGPLTDFSMWRNKSFQTVLGYNI